MEISNMLQALNDVRREYLEEKFENFLSELKLAIQISPFEETYTLTVDVKYKDYFIMKLTENGIEFTQVFTYTGSFNGFKVKIPISFKVKEPEPVPSKEGEEKLEEKPAAESESESS